MTSVTWVPVAVYSSFECTNDASIIAHANTASSTAQNPYAMSANILQANIREFCFRCAAYDLGVLDSTSATALREGAIEGCIEDNATVQLRTHTLFYIKIFQVQGERGPFFRHLNIVKSRLLGQGTNRCGSIITGSD